jgi:hypothetical protein
MTSFGVADYFLWFILFNGFKVFNSYHIMSIVLIKNRRVELRKENGSLIRAIGNGHAADANLNGDNSLVIVTSDNGHVELRKENGSLIRTVGNGHATGAKFSGSDILIHLSSGKKELRKENGS